MNQATIRLLIVFIMINTGFAGAADSDEMIKQYQKMHTHHFSINIDDVVKGEKSIAIHQIVLITCENCKHCDKVKKNFRG